MKSRLIETNGFTQFKIEIEIESEADLVVMLAALNDDNLLSESARRFYMGEGVCDDIRPITIREITAKTFDLLYNKYKKLNKQ